jgi:glutamyl-Q tRNA(Asp) synthetase
VGAGYRGRFAPSPSGPLHFGSIVTAVASFLDARHHGGEWLVRMEDIDETRTVPGAADRILRQLEAHGLAWDGEVVGQSARKPLYSAALERLTGHTYRCACSRREAASCQCRAGLPPGKLARAVRVHGAPGMEDFTIRRADGLFAYQLAVVVDDFEQGISHVVRGADLLDSTPRQQWLQHLLGYQSPEYLHVPVVKDPEGRKLSKQNHASAAEEEHAAQTLREALQFLEQPVPEAGAPREILDQAVACWSRVRLL